MKFLFWLSVLFIFYTYLGYPCLLFVWSRLFPRKVKKAYLSPEPMVSIIIAARNEEGNIGTRIENLLNQNYPPKKMEIVIVSDGSTDATHDIVRQFSDIDGKKSHSHSTDHVALRLVELDHSKGKPNALNHGIRQAKGDFIVFSDARQKFESNAIKELVANFNDQKVGCVSGELVFYEASDTAIEAEMGFYWNLEKRIRKMESTIHSVAGATGAIYAVRKSLFQTIPEETLLDDVFIPMNIVFQGYRIVFDGQAIAYDTVSRDFAQEKKRKVRTLFGNYQLLKIIPQLLSPTKNPLFFRYLSHKVFRLFVPFFFLAFLFSSFMIKGVLYNSFFLLGILTLVLPVFDKWLSSIRYLGKLTKLARTFVSLNYFALLAFFYLIWPGKKKIW